LAPHFKPTGKRNRGRPKEKWKKFFHESWSKKLYIPKIQPIQEENDQEEKLPRTSVKQFWKITACLRNLLATEG
jgi:hypothetical protein